MAEKYIISDNDTDGQLADWLFRQYNQGSYESLRDLDAYLVNRQAQKIEPGSEVIILDKSIKSNKEGLKALISKGCKLIWIDHHAFKENEKELKPDDEKLEDILEKNKDKVETIIEHNGDKCTAYLVDEANGSRYKSLALLAMCSDFDLKHVSKVTEKSKAELAKYDALTRIYDFNSIRGNTKPNELYELLKKYEGNLDKAYLEITGNEKYINAYKRAKGKLAEAIKTPEKINSKTELFFLTGDEDVRALRWEFGKSRIEKDVATIVVTEENDKYKLAITSPFGDAEPRAKKLPMGGGRKNYAAAAVPRKDFDEDGKLNRSRLTQYIKQKLSVGT